MDTLTTKAIHAAFAAAIRGIEPRFAYKADATWHHDPRARDTELEGAALRNFYLVFGAAKPSDLWTGGAGRAYTCNCAVVTSYAGVEFAQLEHMLVDDGSDLLRVLGMLRDPALPGLADVIALGLGGERFDSGENVIIEHRFAIHWHQAT